MAKEKKDYDVFKGLLNGKQVNTLHSEILNKATQKKAYEGLDGATTVFVLHDPCEIRKPSAPKMEHVGKVLSLDKKVINGYRSFNSVAIDIEKQGVHLVSHTLYSTGSPDYVKQEVIRDLSNAEQYVQDMVKNNEHINTSVCFENHIKESSNVLKRDRSGVNVCHILDREFDNTSFFEYITEQKDTFVIRLKTTRLSNEIKTIYTKSGKVSKQKAYLKLIDKTFKNKGEYLIERLSIKGKLYHNIRCVIEWESLGLNSNEYSVVRIRLYDGNKSLFKEPMLLVTNKKVKNLLEATGVYKAYILRFKIEVVFKFLKQNLGWEGFQIRDFNSIKNLLALAFFLVGYFKELEEELKKHPMALYLCQLAKSKGKITMFFLLEGLAKVVSYFQVEIWMKENNIERDQLQEMMEYVKSQNTDVQSS